MATTPVYGLHFPALSDAPNVPQWVQDLAEDVEDQIARLDATAALLSQLPVTIRKPANQTVTSSTTLVDDTHFAFPVAANAVYALESYLIFTGAASPAGGLKMQFTGPAGATMTWTNFGTNGAGVGTLTDYNVVAESISSGAPRAVGTNAGTVMTCRPVGTVITAGTSGTLQFRWAQNASDATPTLVGVNSWMRLTKIT
jgi:hypothetical protein